MTRAAKLIEIILILVPLLLNLSDRHSFKCKIKIGKAIEFEQPSALLLYI